MADTELRILVDRMSQLLKPHTNLLIRGAEKELEQLKDELVPLKYTLRDLESKQLEEDRRLIEMERQLDVIYEVDDTIDSCLTQAAAAKARKIAAHFHLNRLNLAEQFKSLREEKVKPLLDRVLGAVRDKRVFSFSSLSEPSRTKLNKVQDQTLGQHQMVGFKDEVTRIINDLMDPSDKLHVISIVGMPGSGKTRLAWEIYQNPNIEYEFPIRIWVHLSQELNKKGVLLDILKEITNETMSGLSYQDLCHRVCSFLKHKKYLLVMDNVWNTEIWNVIKDVLPSRNGTGKVLITSRSMRVGRYANRDREPYKMQLLTHRESWELLQLEIFGTLDACPYEELRRIGENIAAKCWGLPLKIVKTGGILFNKLSTSGPMDKIVRRWDHMYENMKEDSMFNDIMLPKDLQACFLYLGGFPEDYEIPTGTLTRLWIAEGFIPHKEDICFEETASDFLYDLIERNLVLVLEKNGVGKPKIISVHPSMRAFCISEERSLFTEVKMSRYGDFDLTETEIKKCRRLCIHSHLQKFLSSKLDAPRVRSFLCFRRDLVDIDPVYMSTIVDAFKLLRVLDSKSINLYRFPTRDSMSSNLHCFPTEVTKLIHLRYLTLSVDCDLLPEAISRLWNLQTLVVNTSSRSLRIKANIWRMIQLRHLKTKAAIILAAKEGEGNGGENLQTLSRLSPEDCTGEVFRRASNLTKLGIRGELASFYYPESLERLDRLEKLKLVNESEFENGPQGLSRLMNSFFPPNLSSLTLSATFLDWKHMRTLGRIQNLEVLKLRDRAFMGMSWEVVGDGFRCLRFLLIKHTDLVEWKASTDHFPRLRSLILNKCCNLKEIPIGLVKSLEKLEIKRLPKSAVESARKIDQVKMQMQKSKGGRKFEFLVHPSCQI